MSSSCRIVALHSGPGFIAAATALLWWPDRTQAKSYLSGFGIIGDIEDSGVFSRISQTEEHSDEFFGLTAIDAVYDLARSTLPREAQSIFDATVSEQDKGGSDHS